MLDRNNPNDPVYQFLAGTFHQDAGMPEEALKELLSGESIEYRKNAIDFLTAFLESNHLESEKNDYIRFCADGVYFPELNMSPIQWLWWIVEQLKESVK